MKSRLKEAWNKYEVQILILIVTLLIFLGFGYKCYYNYKTGIAPISPYHKDTTSTYTGTEVTINNINNNNPEITLESLSIKSNNNYYISLDSESLNLIKSMQMQYKDSENNNITDKLLYESADIYNYCALSYTYENSDRTFIISQDDLDIIDISNTESIDKRVYEENYKDEQITTYLKDNDYRMYYLELSQNEHKLTNTTNTGIIKNIESNLKYTDEANVEQEKLTINLEGLGTLNAEQLNCLKEAPGVYYTTNDGIIRLYNYKDDIPYAFITNIDNYYFLCNKEDLEKTNVQGLYIESNWDNPESTSYRTIAIERTDGKGMYVIRVASEAPESTLEEIVNQFNLSLKNI